MPTASIRDLEVYYELHGPPGAPALVLLNGALGTIDSDWADVLPAFAEHYRVLAYDHRGHGRTSAAAPLSGFEQLAADLAGLLDALDIGPAHFCGFSDGGNTLLYFALSRPERVRSLILAGAQYTNDQITLAMLAKMTPERISEHIPGWAAALAEQHDTHHGPGYWPTLMRQMIEFWPSQPDLTLEQLARIDAPALIIAGELDQFGHVGQQVAMRRAMPRAELCILPATNHPLVAEQPELFRLIALQFLQRIENV